MIHWVWLHLETERAAFRRIRMGYAMFVGSLAVYVHQQRELNLFLVEKSVDIAHEIAEHFKIDLAAIKQCMIH